MTKLAIIAALLMLTGCVYQPQTGPYYGRTPADQMLEVGQTLIRADQGTL